MICKCFSKMKNIWTLWIYAKKEFFHSHISLNLIPIPDGGGIHDVIGTRCDPYTHSIMSGGTVPDRTCHQNLVVSLGRFLNQNDGAIKESIEKSFNDLPAGMLVSFSHVYETVGAL